MRYRRTAATMAVLALAITACGGDDVADPVAEPAEEPTTDEVEEPVDESDEATEPEEDEAAAGDECSPDSLATFEPGTLTVATGDPAFPPWVENDDPESGEGFEAAVVYALAEELGFAEGDVAWVRTGFDEAIAPGPKDYDFNLQQFSIREDRRELVDLSVPYYEPDKAIVALPDSDVADATSFEDLQGATWGATIGTTDLDYIVNEIGIPDADVQVFDDQAGTFQALQGGQIDATVVALPTALFATAVQVPEAEITGVLPPDPNDEGLGLLLEQGSPLTPCIDQALDSLREQGVLDDLATEWLGVGADIPEITP